MKGILKAGSLIVLTVMCATVLTGCGEKRAEHKIGKEARYYVADKYGFRPRTTDVELRHVGELEGVWHRKDGGTATCEYEGHTFKVYVSLENPEIRYDDYLKEAVDAYLTDYMSAALDCEDIYVWATYGTPVCMIPGDIKTAEDVINNCDNIQINVSTCGLNRDNAKEMDVTEFRSDTEINIIDWTKKDCIEDKELFSETKIGLQTGTFTDGFNNISSWYCYANGDVRSMEK